MSLYTRHQIVVLLVILGVAGAGLAVGHWRRLHPDLVDRIERLDRAPAVDGDAAPAGEAPAAPARPPRRAKLSAVAARAPDATKPAPPEAPLDLNTASAHELTRLPGVGPVLAERIVGARPYASVEDVRRVRGLGRSKLERLRDMVTVTER